MPARPYEVTYIIDPDLNEERTGAMVERFRALAEAQGASDIRVDTETLGRRRLAYEINHKREGQYVVMIFESEAAAPAEVERVLKITDGILRSLVIRLEKMPPLPEARPEAPAAPAAVATPAPENPEATGPEAEPAGLMESPEQYTTEPSFPTPNPADDGEQGQALTDATEPDQPAS